MADLIAQGSRPQSRWRRPLPNGQWIVIGRAADTWSTAWDELISRRHAELRWQNNRLEVRKLPNARNAIFLRGQEAVQFEVKPGEHFVIGETTFSVTDEEVQFESDLPQPAEEHAFNSQELQRLRFRNADQRLDVLTRLPDVISGAATDSELFVRLVNMLLAGVMRADVAAVVAVTPGESMRPVVALHWDRRIGSGGDFQPSQRLILEAIRVQGKSVLHVWGGNNSNRPASNFTMTENLDWAFCSPVKGTINEIWGLYLAGRFQSPAVATPSSVSTTDLRDDVKFTEMVAAILSALRQIRNLQRQHAALSQFFSPVVLGTLEGEDPEVMLAPRETEVSVLFCDLRGFSRESERHGSDLLGLLQRVSKALGVMTRNILQQGGVVGDFQGDAAMGFWGWPLPQEDRVERACQAALGIRAEFAAAAREEGNALADFQMGIGIATGRAVAGKIGTLDQGKVTVFGPVVNLASRLEGMTKLLHAPIILDETTAEQARKQMSKEKGRCRKVAVIKPYGLDTALTVTELLPPESEYPLLTDQHVQEYEAAVELLVAGKWSEAFQKLHRVPPDDLVKDFLTVFIAQHNRTPPANWNGVIPLTSKS